MALISHTMKDETAQKLAEEYGFDLREPMDSSIKFCRIAEGSADIYPRHGPTMEWDIAAGHAVLAAAGGQVKTVSTLTFSNSAGLKDAISCARMRLALLASAKK